MIEPTHEQNLEANKLAVKLIKVGRDDFDLSIAQTLHILVEQVKQKRSISARAARKIVRELLSMA